MDIFDPVTLQDLGNYSTEFGSLPITTFAIGTQNQIYFSGNFTPYLKFFSPNDSTLISISGCEGLSRYLSVSPDGTTFIAVDDKGVKRYLHVGVYPNFYKQSPITDRIEIFRADWTNSRIFITRQNTVVEVWDMSLSSKGSFLLSTTMFPVTGITALMVNSNSLYVAYTVQMNSGLATLLVEYDIATARQTRSWTISSVVQSLLGSEKGRYLFACTSTDQWIVDIGGTP
jgi:hypothetical protein